MSELKASLDDPEHPLITYRRGRSGIPTPVLRGTGVRVETIVVARQRWGQSVAELAGEYDIPAESVQAALDYNQAHPEEFETLIRIEKDIEARRE